jgi:hypothetical protein
MSHGGWTRTTLKVGEKLSIEYNPVKDGRAGGYFLKATHADGSASAAKPALPVAGPPGPTSAEAKRP